MLLLMLLKELWLSSMPSCQIHQPSTINHQSWGTWIGQFRTVATADSQLLCYSKHSPLFEMLSLARATKLDFLSTLARCVSHEATGEDSRTRVDS